MNLRRFFIGRAIGFFILIIIVVVYFYFFKIDNNLEIANDSEVDIPFLENINTDVEEIDKDFGDASEDVLFYPIDEFKSRITKKPFGIYISPETSPVQPEKFSGYHTGVDVEYGDKPDEEIKVLAIADGTVVRSGWVSGYGGMLAIRHNIDGQEYLVIYGHLAPDSLPELNKKVSPGDTIGVLGAAYSHDTAGERKHLHLAIYTGTDINVRGYVSKQADLAKWLDPLEFFTQAD